MKKNGTRPLKWTSGVVGRSKAGIAALCVLQILTGLGGVLYALIFREIVDSAVAGDEKAFFTYAAAFGASALIMIALGTLSRILADFTVATVENRFKKRLFSALLRKDYARVTATHSGEWINRLTSDTAIVAGESVRLLPSFLGLAVRLVGAAAAMVVIEYRLLFVIIPCGLAFVVFSYAFRGVLKRLHRRIREADGRLRVFLQERLGSLLIVRAFSGETQSESEADALMSAHRRTRLRRSAFSGASGALFSLAMNGLYVGCAVYCGLRLLHGEISYGSLTAIIQLVGQVSGPFASISGYLPRYYSALSSAERLMEAESFPAEAESFLTPAQASQLYNEGFVGVALRGVRFAYPAADGAPAPQPVFESLDLEVLKGQYVALVGPSGCGKSTVLKLLMRFYAPLCGDALLLTDGGEQPLTPTHRALFAYVPQGSRLMTGTVREALTFGCPERAHDDAALSEALRVACADGFVSELKRGLDAPLGERGEGLSEGQLQRLAIARAVFTGRPVLMLDEATSALDAETEKRLLQNLRTMTDRTVLFVTHRPAALEICDKVIKL